ncbi:DNA-3-methyladenine glycosylase I [Gallibacterium anatis]|uniref:DNA-3-methyladenine glycosylase I n=1 Tax=Gallibacterium anatis TaxID=750 RepID=UPI0022322F2E|nr:DNA-3-methyladenine glycosylase I [Gallibacterium anatis]UZD16551.1 DNA-3-methyladenine glycosylase I [Gallibacterium anatis]
MSYCDYVNQLAEDEDPFNKSYHDHRYGFPIEDDNELFARLVMEINQAGLSWTLILKKEQGFRLAYDQFNIAKVANYNDEDRQRLLNNPDIIRNRLKINAAIYNAKQILQLQQQFGSFKAWLDHHYPKPLPEWVKLFKKQFKFVGGEIVNEFLMSTGYLPNAHDKTCPIYQKILQTNVKWKASS